MKDFLHRMLNRAHRSLLAISRGRIGGRLGSMLVVELHTLGRRSRVWRRVMLTAPIHEDGRFVLVASKGGDPRHPSWYLNLVDHPEVELTVGARTYRMRARTASHEERAALWPRIIQEYPGYARYQRKTTREIPVVICES